MDPEANAELSNPFPVPQAITKAGNSRATIRGEAKQGVCESVPHVPHVPRKNKERGEEASAREVTPDSRHPLIPHAIRAKIEAIEADARAKGWPAELLWNASFWDCPRGLAALLDAQDEIGEVTPDFIEVLKTRHHLLRFRRQTA